jgi:hypothetical protein
MTTKEGFIESITASSQENQGEYLVPMPVIVEPELTNPIRRRDRHLPLVEDSTTFWVNKPNVLLTGWQSLFPDASMTMTEKLNALTRFIILLTILIFAYTQKLRILFIGVITLCAIVLFYNINVKQTLEQFTQEMDERTAATLGSTKMDTGVFDVPKPGNPFSNVPLADFQTKANKKPAPPLSNAAVRDEVLEAAKKTVLSMNPTQPDLADKLFKNMGDEFIFEQSLRQFHSQPNTTIPNDQEAFSKFCYGSMISCKEGNAFACARNNPRYKN